MSLEFDFLNSLPADLIINLFVIIFLLGISLFSFLVIRQVGVMSSVVDTKINPFLKLGAQIQFVASILLLLLATITLIT